MADRVALRAAAIRELWLGNPEADEPSLFAVVDAARDPAIYPALRRLQQSGAEVIPLYQGQAMAELASVGPYLVGLGTDKTVFDWIWTEGWGKAWCILIWSLVSTDVLRDHLRRHTKVRTDDGGMLLFRFYDPRVMRAIIPQLDAAQQRDLFGPIARITVEGEDPRRVTHYVNRGTRVVESHVDLAELP